MGVEREEGLVPQILFGLVFGLMLSFTGTMAITQKVHSKNQNKFYQIHKNTLLMDLQKTSIDETEFQASKEVTLLLAYQSLKDYKD